MQRPNADLIQRATEQFSWEKSFRYLNINEMVFLFNKAIKNIYSNFIPHEQSLVMTEIHLGSTTTSNS